MNKCTFMENRESRNSKTEQFNRYFSNLTIPVSTDASYQDALTHALKTYEADIDFGECRVVNEWLYSNSKSVFITSEFGDFKITVVDSKSVTDDRLITIIEGLCVKG